MPMAMAGQCPDGVKMTQWVTAKDDGGPKLARKVNPVPVVEGNTKRTQQRSASPSAASGSVKASSNNRRRAPCRLIGPQETPESTTPPRKPVAPGKGGGCEVHHAPFNKTPRKATHFRGGSEFYIASLLQYPCICPLCNSFDQENGTGLQVADHIRQRHTSPLLDVDPNTLDNGLTIRDTHLFFNRQNLLTALLPTREQILRIELYGYDKTDYFPFLGDRKDKPLRFLCPQCSEKFARDYAFFIHLAMNHGRESPEPISQLSAERGMDYWCSFFGCHATFLTLGGVIAHQQIAHSEMRHIEGTFKEI